VQSSLQQQQQQQQHSGILALAGVVHPSSHPFHSRTFSLLTIRDWRCADPVFRTCVHSQIVSIYIYIYIYIRLLCCVGRRLEAVGSIVSPLSLSESPLASQATRLQAANPIPRPCSPTALWLCASSGGRRRSVGSGSSTIRMQVLGRHDRLSWVVLKRACASADDDGDGAVQLVGWSITLYTVEY